MTGTGAVRKSLVFRLISSGDEMNLEKTLIALTDLAAVATWTPANAYEFGFAGWAQKPGLTIGGASAGVPPPGLYSFNQVLTYQAPIVGPGAPNIGGGATQVHGA
jgi:hypothetical protein